MRLSFLALELLVRVQSIRSIARRARGVVLRENRDGGRVSAPPRAGARGALKDGQRRGRAEALRWRSCAFATDRHIEDAAPEPGRVVGGSAMLPQAQQLSHDEAVPGGGAERAAFPRAGKRDAISRLGRSFVFPLSDAPARSVLRCTGSQRAADASHASMRRSSAWAFAALMFGSIAPRAMRSAKSAICRRYESRYRSWNVTPHSPGTGHILTTPLACTNSTRCSYDGA